MDNRWSGRWALLAVLLGTWAGAVTPVRISVSAPDVLVFGAVGMAPLTPLAEIWGAQLTSAKGAVTFTRGAKTFTCTPWKTAARANGQPVTLPLAPFQRAGVTYAPLRPLVAALGGTVTPQGKQECTISVPNAAPLTCLRWEQQGTTAQYRDAEPELYIINLDGTGRRRLTYNWMYDDLPYFSPDGTRMLCRQVYILPPGTPLREHERLVLRTCDNSQEQRFPSELPAGPGPVSWYLGAMPFFPDGQEIVFTVNRDDRPVDTHLYQICVADLAGRQVRVLGTGIFPSFSPDGQRIVYNIIEKQRPGFQVYLMNRDGSNPHYLFDGILPWFIWNGTTVLAQLRMESLTQRYSITRCALNAGGNAGQLYSLLPERDTYNERFSRDERQLLYQRTGAPGIFLADGDGQHGRRLTSESADSQPTFTADGQHILFFRGTSLMTMRLDGSHPLTVTTVNVVVPSHAFLPTPDGTQVLFMDYPERPAR